MSWQNIRQAKDLRASQVVDLANRLTKETPPDGVERFRVFVLRNITLETLLPYCIVSGAHNNMALTFELSGYADSEALVYNKESILFQSEVDLLWVWFELSKFSQMIWYELAGLTEDVINSVVEGTFNRYQQFVELLSERFSCPIIVQNFRKPGYPTLRLYDRFAKIGQYAAIDLLNQLLFRLCRDKRQLYYFDYDRMVSQVGTGTWTDPKMWLTAKIPVASCHHEHFANTFVAMISAIYGRRKKCIVVDLDNTLWGGIVGEDGMEGIQIGHTYPGNAYKEFQRQLLSLYHQGILLAICSKNNENDVFQVFQERTEMVLRLEHFAACRVNWKDKATNILDIAEELNIGIDSLVFLDDNPAERELVRQKIPGVVVPDLPEEPFGYAGFLAQQHWFDTLQLSPEDKKRTRLYVAQKERTILANATGSLEDYYRSLEMEIHIESLNALNLPRITQLTQKTNQFNLTTRRYTDEQVLHLVNQGGLVWCARVVDRFGDNGITALCMVRIHNDKAEIDTFLLSCRVIGRTVETAFLYWILNYLRQQGIKKVRGQYVPSQKNAQVEDLYAQHHFNLVEDRKDDGTIWEISLDDEFVLPDWFRLRVVDR